VRLAAFALFLNLSACGGMQQRPEPEIKVVETKVPVSVPCKAEVEVRKSYSDAAAEFITDIYQQAAALLQGRKERMADQKRLEGGVVSCGGTVTAK
jgi:hypothetical protein